MTPLAETFTAPLTERIKILSDALWWTRRFHPQVTFAAVSLAAHYEKGTVGNYLRIFDHGDMPASETAVERFVELTARALLRLLPDGASMHLTDKLTALLPENQRTGEPA